MKSVSSMMLLLSCWFFVAQGRQENKKDESAIVVGAERLGTYLPYLKGKRVAIAANHTSLIGKERSIDTLLSRGVQVVKLFGPEHGLSGATSANTFVSSGKDEKTGIPVFSLFGDHNKPTKEELKDVDLMLFDMQDVGARFYTYISTLHYVMEACAENNIPLLVLDRPNPHDGYVDGPVLEKGYQSFIGMHPVPIVHGMTIGEYAQMINGQGWLANGMKCKLSVVQMLHYYHGKDYTLSVPPSPNLNTQQAIYLYPSLCWFGATAISDGRGTYSPFQLLGNPEMKGMFRFSFKPQAIKGMSEHPMHEGKDCYGLDLRAFDVKNLRKEGKLNLRWLLDWYRWFPDKKRFFNGEDKEGEEGILHFDHLAGNSTLRQQIKSGKTEKEIRQSWEPQLSAYKKMRQQYVLYP